MSISFWQVLQMSFMQRALIAGSFLGMSAACLGLLFVLRRQSMMGDGLSHFAFAAVGLGLLLGAAPLWTAMPLAILAAYIVLRLPEKNIVFGDTAVGIISSVGLALGVLLAGIGNGFTVDLFGYLFGDILTVSRAEMWASAAVFVGVLLLFAVRYHELFAVTFDREYAHVQGIQTNRLTPILAIFTGIIIVLGMKIVGALLFSGLLIFPAITALQLAKSFRGTCVLAAVISLIGVWGGMMLAFFLNLPAGAAILLLNALLFASAFSLRRLFRLP